MGILDIFKRKNDSTNESNTLFGQTALGNQVVLQGNKGKYVGNNQLLYVTTSATTVAGRTVDVSVLSRNSTVMSCVGVKARALAQLPIKVMAYNDKGLLVDALLDESVGPRDQIKAKQVYSLLSQPNNFQSCLK